MVPEGWSKSTVGDCSDTVMGFAFSSADFVEHGVPLLRMGNLYQNQLDLGRKAVSLPANFLDEYERFVVIGGDLVMSMTGTLGKRDYGFTVVIPKDTEACLLNQRVMKFVPKDNTDGTFLLYLLRSDAFLNKLYSFPGGTKQANLSASQVKEIGFPCPPLPEQRKIADILSTWDEAIEKTEALLTKARTQKRALMQQLLTGKRRFPAFEGQPWKEVRLGDVGIVSSAGVDKKSEADQPDVRLLNFLDVFRREFIFDNDLNHVVTAPPAKVEKCNVLCGDIFFTPSSETRNDIAISAVAAEDMPGVCYSYHVVRFRPTEPWDLNFRAYVFQTDDFRKQAYKLGDGGGQRYVISQGNFRNMVVRVPSIAEQQQIGRILRAASEEVSDLEKQITKLRTEKKALMQQLLTGKRRVVV